jgi:hypothetical protein
MSMKWATQEALYLGAGLAQLFLARIRCSLGLAWHFCKYPTHSN